MRQIIYTMQFKGTATPGAEEGVLKATTSATSCTVQTVIGNDGVTSAFHVAEGGMAFFESEVRMTGKQKFQETGSIAFGEGDHSLEFSTVGEGHMEPSADPTTVAGAVSWKVDRGEGQFAGATGYITSNFQVSSTGEVTDHHVGVIYVK